VSDPRLALTFDAEHPSRSGADPEAPSRILDALEHAGVRATFFVQGRWATAHPGLARRIARDGHLVGNHSNYHAPMTLLSPDGLRTDVREAERRIVNVTGVDPRPWFRCPFGEGADRADVNAALADLGYTNVSWDVDSGDWYEEATAESILSLVVDQPGNGGEAGIVLFHTWPSATAEAMPRLLAELGRLGATFVPLEELVHVR
jgi:peptidoglycan/xylan/chitin deacetylase (PgdA/CDA1 family)